MIGQSLPTGTQSLQTTQAQLLAKSDFLRFLPNAEVPTGSPSRGRDVAVYVFDINQPSSLAPFYSALASVSVFMAASTALHSINSPDNSLLSHSVVLVLFPPYWSFQLHISF